jgi:hypothetical protein
MSTEHPAGNGGETAMTDADDFMAGDAGIATPSPSINDRSAQYRQFVETAAKLVADGVANVDEVSSHDLPTNDDRLSHCVQLTLDAMDNQDNAPKQSDLARSPDEIDWQAIFDEFGLWHTSANYPGASYVQLAGALAVSKHTGYRSGASFGRQALKEVVDQAVQIGALQPISRNGDVLAFFPRDGRPHNDGGAV